MKKLCALILMFFLFSCSCGSDNSCKEYELVHYEEGEQGLVVKDVTEQDAKCISEQLYEDRYRMQVFTFYKYKDDYENELWKYIVMYDADYNEKTKTVLKDSKGHFFVIRDTASINY